MFKVFEQLFKKVEAIGFILELNLRNGHGSDQLADTPSHYFAALASVETQFVHFVYYFFH